MPENRLGKWFEKKYLEYQMENGLCTLKEFAEFLGISRPYLSLLLNGERTDLSQHVALMIAERLNDYALLEMLGIDRPPETLLPPELRSNLDSAVEEISRTYRDRGVTDFSSDEALTIANDILSRFGFTYKNNSK